MESSHEPNNGGATSTPNKRRHPHHHQQQHITFKTPPPPLKLSPNDTIFRLLCPATKTGRLIGKAGTIIRQLREETGARIRIEDPVANCDERVILIAAETLKKAEKEPGSSVSGEEEVFLSPGQQALVRIYDKIFEERLGGAGENEVGVGGEEKNAENSGAVAQNTVVCRILAASNQVGCVFGRGGKVVEKLRQESGTQIRVLAAREQIPLCAPPGEELIQITGSFSAVRKALLSVSNCLQDNPRVETASSPAATLGTAMPFTSTTHAASEYRGNIPEQEVVFKLLCHFEKVGNLIGKGGSVIRALKSDTGASIKILDAAPDSDERVVVISAKENMEQNRSSAQEGVIRVQTRIAEIGSEPGAAVVARLLVPSQQIGCLMGKGGAVITEMRQVTGASIRIFTRDPAPKRAAQDDEIVQIIGSLKSVQDALFHITSRLRETIFPMKVSHPSNGPTNPMFRPRYDPSSPATYPSPIGFHNSDPLAGCTQQIDREPPFFHGVDHSGVTNLDQPPYHYGRNRSGHGLPFDQTPSPRSWPPQPVSGGTSRFVPDVGTEFVSGDGVVGSGSQTLAITRTTIEVVVPCTYLGSVYGENCSNLNQIIQISGAKVVVNDPRPGTTEGVVVVSGTPHQIRVAQSLIHAFILADQPF